VVASSGHQRHRGGRRSRVASDLDAAFAAGGEMGRRVQGFDWSTTPLGPLRRWPPSLRNAVSGCLLSPVPLSLAWGPELTYLYNDGMRRLLGSRHPAALGRPEAELSGSRRDGVEPLHLAVLSGRRDLDSVDEQRFVDLEGRLTEMYQRTVRRAVRDETGGVAGVLASTVEVTGELVAGRRLRALEELTRLPARARSLQEACGMAASAVAGDAADTRFALIYLSRAGGRTATLAASAGLPAATPATPLSVALRADASPWGMDRVAARRVRLESDTAGAGLGTLRSWPPGGPPVTVWTVPLPTGAGSRLLGFLVLGLSPVIPPEADVTFFELLSGQVVRALTAVAATEEPPVEQAEGDGCGQAGEAGARAAERQRLARDLHDCLIPTLYGISLGAERLTELTQRQRRARDVAEYVQDLATGALREVRALVFELRPEPLERASLDIALRELAAAIEARQSVRIAVSCEAEPGCSTRAQEAIYRIAQEALANVVRHAHAGSATVSVGVDAGRLRLEVTDDGVGFDTAVSQPGHLGQRSMRERAAALGGSLGVASRLGGGTTVSAEVPCQ
jgi:signal transduction histidine kinase